MFTYRKARCNIILCYAYKIEKPLPPYAWILYIIIHLYHLVVTYYYK